MINSFTSNKTIPCIWRKPCFSFIAPVPNPRNPWSLKENATRFEKSVDPGIADAMKRGRFNIPFCDMTPLLREHETGGKRLYRDYDFHMKGKGYLLVGEYLFKRFESELKWKRNFSLSKNAAK